MAEYLSPGVYIEDNPNPPVVVESVSASTGGFIGIAQRGVVGKPTFITSWNAYIDNFAYGMVSPFLANSDLAYAVYGFFQNGGKRCYITRVASSKAAVAKLSGDLVIEAKDAGEWGNNLKITITANDDVETNFDLKVSLDTEDVEIFTNLSNTESDSNYWIDALEQSDFIKGVSGTLIAKEETALSGGADGVTDITDKDFVDALKKFDTVDDVNLICIPGQTSEAVNTGIMEYCETRKDVFAILDAPEASTVDSVKALRKKMSCKNAALLFPWIKVSDPLSKKGKLRNCPTCGHAMGVYARIIAERGVWKVPAGTEAIVRGAIEVVTTLTPNDTDALNPMGIVSIMPKSNYGIVIWGARNLHPDTSMKYISDVLLDINIKKTVYNATQQFVFEPNDVSTWTRIKATIETYLDSLWRDGALSGETSKEAYFVKCDEELNNATVRSQGKIVCEVGYANKKPAEFVIFRFSHEMASN